MSNFEEILRHKYDLILAMVVVASVAIYIGRNFIYPQTECAVRDVYNIEWSECQISGVQTSKVTRKPDEEISCSNPDEIEKPTDVRSCDYVPVCTKENFEIGAWGTCIDGTQTRTVKNLVKCEISEEDENANTFEQTRSCSKESILLLRGFTTQVDPEASNKYSPSYRNVSIIPEGEFKSLRLVVSADTIVLGGKHYTVPDESYYFMFAINDSVARALATSRISNSRLDVSDKGVFRGEEFPIKKEFDLTDTYLALSTEEGAGSIPKDYAKFLSERDGQELEMTLFLGDGRSMVTEDPKERIFGTITEAYLEYECASGSQCSIKRIPELK